MKLSKQMKNLKAKLIDSIDFKGVGYDKYDDTLKGLFDCCYSEMKHRFDKGDNPVAIIIDWLMGLPSAINMPFAYYDIQQLMLEVGYKKYDLFDNHYRLLLALFIINDK